MPEIPTPLSLAVILVVLAVTTVASLIRVRAHPEERAHAGSVFNPHHRLAEKRPEAEPEH